MSYVNTCHTLTTEATPDPFVVRANGQFYMTFTAGNRIEIWSSKSLTGFQQDFKKDVIWTPLLESEHSADLWAPELHAIRGRWYVYYTAAHPTQGNKSHRIYVLGGPPATDDPGQGPWEFLGRIHGMPDQWAIDGTIMELNQNLYLIYSGWPLDDVSESDLIQQIFIMKLSDPTTAASKPVVISNPEQPWEFTRDANGEHGINEGPQFLESPDKSWRGIVYSCAGSWTKEYKLAVLHYGRGDPLDPRSWPKGQEPLLQTSRSGKGPWGPGHGSFVALGEETLCVFHGTDNPTDGWTNRKARCQRVIFTDNGPYMGLYCAGGRKQASRSGLIGRLQRSLSKRIQDAGLQPQKDNTLRMLLESN